MVFVWMLAGAIAGLIVGGAADRSTSALGLVAGIVIGLLFWRVGSLSERIRRSEEQLDDLWASRAQAEPPAVQASAAAPASAQAAAADIAARPSPTFDIDLGAPVPAPPSPEALAARAAPAPVPRPFYPPPTPAEPGGAERAIEWVKRWFTEGNVPVKVGMLVLFAGVAALLKYAADEGWFTFPIELRLAGIALAGIAALAFGWRQREQRRGFALSLQGGAIGVLLLTVFAAFRLYGLLPPGAAFALMLVLVAGVGVLAVLQNALALAVLGILAGFAAPILISTGSGNHVALFTYYALLNAAILAIAWVRPWRALNLLGFFFTYAIGTLWGVLSYRPELVVSTEPFLILFFVFYLVIPILYAFRREPQRRDAIDGTLVFGNPLVAFALQALLLDGERMPLALSALVLGLVYMLLAWTLIRRARVLGESFAILALGFSTLAVPLALSAQVTACVFALEGAALIWLGLRQQRELPQWIGLFLQLLAAAAFVIGFGPHAPEVRAFANGGFVGAMLISGSALVSAWMYLRAKAASELSGSLYVWGLLWWCGALLGEIAQFFPPTTRAAAVLGSLALTAWLVAEAHRRLERAAALGWTVAVLQWLALAMVLVITVEGQLFTRWTLLALAIQAVLGWRSLACLRESGKDVVGFAHVGWLWIWTAAAGLALRQVALDAALGAGWRMALAWSPVLVIHALTLLRPATVSTPFGARFGDHRGALLGTQVAVLGVLFLAGLVHSGASAPLPYVPLLNPLELALLAALACFALWTRDASAPAEFATRRPLLMAAAGFVFITVATLRGVHHLGGIPWTEGILSASVSQTSLAVVWSVLGVAGWVIGSRRGSRPLWLAGAVLMAVVLVKLLLIDRQHLGNLFGIASFIAYGLLCTLIGYLAPAPPRKPAEEAA